MNSCFIPTNLQNVFQSMPCPSRLERTNSNSLPLGNGTSNNGQSVMDASQDHQESSIQNSSTQTPTTKQSPTLPSIAATYGIPSHPEPFISVYICRRLATIFRLLVMVHRLTSIVAAGLRETTRCFPSFGHSSPRIVFGRNPNHPWNNNSARAPPNPHPVVASATAHSAAAGYLPSTFTPGPISARTRELMNDSTPLEASDQPSRMPNPFRLCRD